jgi:hypothetical protein
MKESKKKREARQPLFLEPTDFPGTILRAELLRKQGWRCATCQGVCTGALNVLGGEVVHGKCYVEQLRVELRA